MADQPSVMESEKPKKKSIIVWQCLNPECTTTNKKILRTASSFALSFYGMDNSSGKKRKICLRCYDIVDSHRRRLLRKLEDGESLLSEQLPVPRDLVLLEDSDENSETDSSEESEFEMDTGELLSSSAGSSSGSAMSGDFEQQLDKIMGSAIQKMNFDKQLTTATKDLKDRLDSFKDDFEATDKMYENLEGEVDNLRKELYKDFEPRIEELPPVDLNKISLTRPLLPSGASGQLTPGIHSPSSILTSHALPPAGGVLSRPALALGQQVIAMRHGNLQTWKPGVVEELQDPGEVDERLYRVRFEGIQGNKNVVQKKLLKVKNVAYSSVSRVRLPVGTRCIGVFRESEDQAGTFYSGVIAEPPKQTNRNRYLVFFDDGYASYIRHEELRLVCYQSENVWDDVHIDSREFIKKYLDKYPERPMVKLSPGQIVKTEWDGRWCQTRVITVDASLVRLKFLDDSRMEWIYRGSTRLGPLFTEMEQQKLRRLQNDEAEKAGAGHMSRRQTAPARRRNAPYIEYRRDAQEAQEPGQGAGPEDGGDKEDKEQVKRPVARKSTTAVRRPEQSATTKWEYDGQTFKTEIDPPSRIKFRQHNCSTNCLADPRYQYKEKNYFRCVETKSPNNDKDLKNFNPLIIPMMLGWFRQVTKHKFNGKVKKKVTYQSPCGRRLRSLVEVHRYLTIVQSKLEIDFFNFDWWLHVYNEFKPGREFCTIKDLSYGKENVAISCVNSIDRSFPEYVEYSTDRLPQKDVNLNTDSEFMTSCDCTDDCRRKDKCACWQLTIQNTRCDRENKIHKDVGYQFRRLNEIVVTGIYECNRNCKCSKTCLNRVVQHPLRVKLQVFKTEKRGWGIRTLHDIPQGAFISVYVGNLYSSEEANKQGQNFGDEYFAELDMIEVIERRKDGYESDVSDEGFNDEEENNKETAPGASKHSSKFSEAKYTSEEYSTEEETNDDRDFNPGLLQFDGGNDDTDEEASGGLKQRRGGFSATVGIAGPKTSKTTAKPQTEKFVSARRMFGKNEDVYIMDAKSIGNIGRYLNHSCNPNIFVQNVFVDTHDLRFPWIAFFTSHFVRAGGELCWDYNYEVGSIPGKELYCSCGSEYCRGKLL